MIAEMNEFVVAGPKGAALEILADLQKAGILHIDPLRTDDVPAYRLDSAEEDRLRRWQEVVSLADHTMRQIGVEADPSAEPFEGDLETAESTVVDWERRAVELVEERTGIQEEIRLIRLYREVVGVLAEMVQGLDQSPRIRVLPFLVERSGDVEPVVQELTSTLEGRFLLPAEAVGGRLAAAILVLKRDVEEARGVLSHHGLAELPLPGAYAGLSLRAAASLLAERALQAPGDLSKVEEGLEGLVRETSAGLRSLWNRAKDESGRLGALRDMASGRYGFALFGWVPRRLQGTLEGVMNRYRGRAVSVCGPVDEGRETGEIPVLLENPAWVEPFEALISFLNTPRYGSHDPTWVVAAFFPLWFGMVVGDIGYGIVFSAVAWLLSGYVRRGRPLIIDFFRLRLPPASVTQVLRIMKPMIAWTLVWGLVYGECFGNLLQRLGVFSTPGHPGRLPILIPRTETTATANMLILVSIGFGVYQVLYGFYLKAVRSRRDREKRDFWEATGYLGGVAALVLFSYAFMTHAFPVWIVPLTVTGAVLFLAGVLRARDPLMIAELPTQGGHILSYIRIYAVGLASAILANLATNMGFALYHLLGFVGLIIGVAAGLLVGLVVHALLLVLLTVSHMLQPIRLIWVEFFTKFDFYSVSGRPYRPFKSVRVSSQRD